MNTAEFLKRVCSEKDEVVITQLNTAKGIFWNRQSFTYNEFDEAEALVTKWDQQKDVTIYFSVGSFANHIVQENGKDKIKRTQDNATFFKSLCFDLDCGEDKPYKTQQEGLIKLVEVVKVLGLPKPLIVSSGNGAHVYWPLTQSVNKELWVKVSKMLRNALYKNDLEIDTSKIHDPSMVLRPVGTHHKKAEWKPVEVVLDDGAEHDIALLVGLLKDYEVEETPVAPRPKSAMLDAILDDDTSNDIDIDTVGADCRQIGALLASGGITDAAGNPVEEPLWRASLGMAKFTPDPEGTIIKLAGQHPEFDLKLNMDKLSGWKGTGPTTCKKFEELCPKGCEGCPFKGNKTSPAQLSVVKEKTVVVENEAGEKEEQKIQMPEGYVMRSGFIWREVQTEDEDGNVVNDTELVSDYMMFIRGVYFCRKTKVTSFTLVVKRPITGWEEDDHSIKVLSANGKDFSEWLLNLQIYGFKTPTRMEKLRGYFMDYLKMVQTQSAIGYDYSNFGWQDDGSFLCGVQIVNPPNGSENRRIVGEAGSMKNVVTPVGTREKFVEAMALLDNPGTETIRATVLLACTGIIAKFMGNGSSIISVYSTVSGTGKSISLKAASALYGNPSELMRGKNDTANGLYKQRGILNNLPMCIDELSLADAESVSQMAYTFSEGKEKLSMNVNRELRTPETWDGPTFMSTNTSLMTKYDQTMANSEPLRLRTLELPQHNKIFVDLRDEHGSVARRFDETLQENYGHAMVELVSAVVSMGDLKEFTRKGAKNFDTKFGFHFESQERFFESLVKSAWIMGRIGHKLGLFPFDIDDTVKHLLKVIKSLRQDAKEAQSDALDVIGQFMQQYNDQMISVKQRYKSSEKPVLTDYDVPKKAIMRIERMYDDSNPIMPGSMLAINKAAFSKYLVNNNDALDRIIRELQDMGALIDANKRVTMFKNCPGRNPGQAWCIIVNVNHQRFIDAMADTFDEVESKVVRDFLDGLKEKPNA